MSEAESSAAATTMTTETCAQCGKTLTPEDRVAAGDKVFCRSCYASLRAELEQAVQGMSSDINYLNATIGAVLGGAVGALLWWGVTAVTHWSIGLFAVAIGYLAGLGAVKFAGDKRSAGLQGISIAAALASYLVASYLVTMSFSNHLLGAQGADWRVPFPPRSLGMFVNVIKAGFGLMDVVFLAIAVYEAWKLPRPPALPPDAAA
jgi:hypothetical protein